MSSATLATSENHVKHAAYNGQNNDRLWGGIPIVILVGDNYQLPSIDHGVLSICGDYHNPTELVESGNALFRLFAKNVMVLSAGSKRQHQNQSRMLDLLAKTRCENQNQMLTDNDIDNLMKYDISRMSNSTEEE